MTRRGSSRAIAANHRRQLARDIARGDAASCLAGALRRIAAIVVLRASIWRGSYLGGIRRALYACPSRSRVETQ